jgi:diphthamide biosynthesis enzyme Dph1/Dph2-like protein
MYNLELDKAVEEIKKNKAKNVCIQLPDGLKPTAKEIQEKIESETDAKVMIWLGSCYGACDTPNLQNVKVDLMIQFGHSPWKK